MSERTVWRLIAHHIDPAAAIAWSRQNRRIAIGWGAIGSLSKCHVTSPSEIAELIRAAYPEITNAHLGGPSLWRLYDRMREGDLVILRGQAAIPAALEITGAYEWESGAAPLARDYQHQRRARVLQLNPHDLWQLAGSAVAPGENIRWTLARCMKSVSL